MLLPKSTNNDTEVRSNIYLVMEPGAVIAAYGAETAVEGAGAAIAIAKPTMPLKARFQRIPTSKYLPRSSHSISVIKGRAYVFGGEIKPREPTDNEVHVYTLPVSGDSEADYECVPAQPDLEGGETPSPRVGHTAAVISDRIYVFGGRGGKEMKPLEENGRIWEFDTKIYKWSYIDPVEGSPYPEARSYHASTADECPLPSKQHSSVNLNGSPGLARHGTIFIHGGCPAKGRLGDVWAFDVASKSWSRLPDAPGAPRGGASLTFAQNRLFRFGGFDGESELGGQIDYLDIGLADFDEQNGKGQIFGFSGQWEAVMFGKDIATPGNRSVAGMHAITTGAGRNFLLLFFGERDPSLNGHEEAGKFYEDVWSYQLQSESMTAASLKDTARRLVGAKTGQSSWAQVEIPEATMSDGYLQRPGARGWFASAQVQDNDIGSILLWGGINERNERQGDGWILTIET